jgi:hypothetical protein
MHPLTLRLLAAVPLAALLACNSPAPGSQATSAPSAAGSAAAGAAEHLSHLVAGDRRLPEAAAALAALGDEGTLREARGKLLAVAREAATPAYREKLRAEVAQANSVAKIDPSPEQLERQLNVIVGEDFDAVMRGMAAVSGAEVVAYGFEVAESDAAPIALRKSARAMLERAKGVDAARLAAASAKIDAAYAAVASARPAAPVVSAPPEGAAGKLAEVRIGGASVSGAKIDNAANVIAGMAAGFRRCVNKALTDRAGSVKHGAAIEVTAKVGAKGEVLSATAEDLSPEAMRADVKKCVTARVEVAMFAAPVGGEGATVRIPIAVLWSK